MGSRLEKTSNSVSKQIQNHTFTSEDGEEYKGSTFGGFGDYMRRKKIKLQNLDHEIRSQSTDKPQIFRGIVAHVNGYTQPSLSDLHTLIVSHGGGFKQYLDGKTVCTHIIASQLTPKKKAEFARYRIVKPAWVVDSVNAGKLLPWDKYRVVDEGVSQKVLGFDNGNIISQQNRPQQTYRDQTDTSWYTSQIRKWSSEIEEHPTDTSKGDTSSKSEDFQDAQQFQERADNEFEEEEDDEENFIGDISPEDASLITPAFEASTLPETISGAYVPSDGDEDASVYATTDAAPQAENSGQVQSVADLNTRAVEKRKLTAEEHNAILLSNPHMAKSSTANPDFLNQYYRESRLHHLSTWKSELKSQLQARAVEKSSAQNHKAKRVSGARRYVMHVDFDSFFAAVSLRKNPDLVEKPVVIAHGSGPGSEIASCNYPAREFGVKNGMWMKSALQLCPDLKVLPYDFKAYEEASRHFYDAILAIDGIVQSISIDEALLDVTDQCLNAGGSDGKTIEEDSIRREQEKANELAHSLRASVKAKTGCEVSVGIGGNILLAKSALRKAKPAGQHQVKPEDVLEFIGELAVTDLPGVAYSLGNKLEELGVKYVKDIRSLTKERLMSFLGPKTGEKLWDYSRGLDKTEVGDQVVRKSVSAEINWGIRFVTQQQAEDFVQCLCDELHKRLIDQGVKGKQLTVKIMRKAADAGLDPPKNLGHGKCDTFNKSVVLGVSTNDKSILGKEAISVLRSYGFPPGELRGLGVQMQKLEPIRPVAAASKVNIDSSQRRLQFQKPVKVAASALTDSTNEPLAKMPSNAKTEIPNTVDSIEDLCLPEKLVRFDSIHGATEHVSSETDKLLNLGGTQFMIPSQIDPSVLAELPADIVAKLAPKQKSLSKQVAQNDSPKQDTESASASPYPSDSEYGLPNQSQLDPDTLAALPEDVRREVLAQYQNDTIQGLAKKSRRLLPQSPRKVKPTVSLKRLQATPTKKNKTTSLLTKTRSKNKGLSFPTLTQSNFVFASTHQGEQQQNDSGLDEEVSKSFLDELPEDIRLEILAEQRRNRMKAKAGLNVSENRRKSHGNIGQSEAQKGYQKLHLPDQIDKPTFTSRRLSSLQDLRDAMSAWVQEFCVPGDEGPFEEDAVALGQYLQKVVTEEKDMDKATSVVNWLTYLISDWPFGHGETRLTWQRIISLLQDMVQEAVVQRGLLPLQFDSFTGAHD